MKVLVITGSAHKNGTTALLADEFIKGASEAGHDVTRFDAAFKNVHPCIACETCHTTDRGCVFKDDMEQLNPSLLSADVIAFVSPVYYYNMNAQIKAVIDRFYANDQAMHKNKKAILITTMADDTLKSADGPNTVFKNMCEFMEWDIAGILNGVAVWTKDNLLETEYPKQAYELGKSL